MSGRQVPNSGSDGLGIALERGPLTYIGRTDYPGWWVEHYCSEPRWIGRELQVWAREALDKTQALD